jgi:hypothetical protein
MNYSRQYLKISGIPTFQIFKSSNHSFSNEFIFILNYYKKLHNLKWKIYRKK